jgi:hypothetical protein
MKINYLEYPTPDNSNILGLPIESADNITSFSSFSTFISFVCPSDVLNSKFFRSGIVVVRVIYLKNIISKMRIKKKKKHAYQGLETRPIRRSSSQACPECISSLPIELERKISVRFPQCGRDFKRGIIFYLGKEET